MPRAARGGVGTHERIYAAVRTIPAGRVTTYGTIARLAGLGGQARLVGYALSALRDGTTVPWHRVINAQGRLSLERAASAAGTTQRLRLTGEGVVVDASGRVSLARFGWKVKGSARGRDARRPTHHEDGPPSHSADDGAPRHARSRSAKHIHDKRLSAR